MKKQLQSVLALFIAGNALAQTARLQVIHNSSEPAADTIDIYANGSLLLDDFAFRSATPYINVDAGVDIELGVAPKSSNRTGGNGSSSIIGATKQTINLTPGGTFVGIANGLLSGEKLFKVFASAGSESTESPKVGLKFFHGSTDAPAVDIVARGVATLAPDLTYGNFSSGYVAVPASKYIVDVNAAGTSTTVVSYDVDISALGGGSAVVFASGFLTPTASQKGFAVLAALPNGTVVNFPVVNPTGLRNEVSDFSNNFLFPNPAASFVSLNNSSIESLEIYDSNGSVVKLIKENVPSILSLNDLNPGVYFVKMYTNGFVHSVKLSIIK